MTTDFQSILEGLGYTLTDQGKEWRTRPIFRDSDNDTVLRISKTDGRWVDFARGNGGDFKKLVEISGGTFNGEVKVEVKKEKLATGGECFDKEEINKIIKKHDYWVKRGVSKETLELFGGGVIQKTTPSSMYGRYVFPVPNNRNEFIGISGRWLTTPVPAKIVKWKHLGRVDSWVYPAFLNKEILLDQKEIILVESIGDGLALWEAGVKNFLVIFGLRVGTSILKTLIAADPNKIIISTNNDEGNNFAGNAASTKIKHNLIEFFDKDQIEIRLPAKNDWGVTDKEEIKKVFL